ncbi:MAG: fibrobacter succinogenes major paralogous domain-containing protein [Bacteroidetes bacterium]|nr:fibrobacter succinogenes major paralogous domain-containing protein [Bacteroidota bacterium]
MKATLTLFLFVLIGTGSAIFSQTVTIGKQVWMTKNLDVATFRNGDPIPEAKTYEEWEIAGENKQPAWCYYKNDPANGAKYGKLYNWYAVNDSRGLAPTGWHIPSDAEWTELTDFLGGEDVAGTKMKSKSGWEEDGNGTNESGFSGLPGGNRYDDDSFNDIGYNGFWWSSTEGVAWSRTLGFDDGSVSRFGSGRQSGFSVRCLRD